jgi:hypothetical protein
VISFFFFWRVLPVTNSPSNPAPSSGLVRSPTAAEVRKIVLREIEARWGKFSEQELSALKGNEDLVAQVVAKYGLEKAKAQRDVDEFLKGRQI